MSREHIFFSDPDTDSFAQEFPDADPARAGYRERLIFWCLYIYLGAGSMPGYADNGNPMQSGMAKFLGIALLAKFRFSRADQAQAQLDAQVLIDLLKKEVGFMTPARRTIGFQMGSA